MFVTKLWHSMPFEAITTMHNATYCTNTRALGRNAQRNTNPDANSRELHKRPSPNSTHPQRIGRAKNSRVFLGSSLAATRKNDNHLKLKAQSRNWKVGHGGGTLRGLNSVEFLSPRVQMANNSRSMGNAQTCPSAQGVGENVSHGSVGESLCETLRT